VQAVQGDQNNFGTLKIMWAML